MNWDIKISLNDLLINKQILFRITSSNFSPSSPNSDQHQISPCNINAYSTPEVMRIKDMITQGEFLDILITSPQLTFIRKVWGQDRGICSLMLLLLHIRSAHLKILGFPMGGAH